MELILILGIASFILLTIAFKLEERHAIVKFFSLMFAVFCLLMLGNAALDTNYYCDTVIKEKWITNIYGDNFTDGSYHWDEHSDPPTPNQITGVYIFNINESFTYELSCIEKPYTDNITKLFYKVTLWFFRLIIVYMLGFMIYLVLDYLRKVNDLKRA